MNLKLYIDHTKLGPLVLKEDVKKLCLEAKEYGFKAVCVSPVWVSYAKELLTDSEVLVATVVGFPHGANLMSVKAFETTQAYNDGADEFDMVINIAALKEKNYDLVLEEIKAVVKAALGKTVKVIIETCYLTDEEIKKATELSLEAKAHFVKTSTGFGTRGAALKDVELMDEVLKGKAEIKASGGIRTYDEALELIEAGATRIGASKGIDIINGEKK